MSASDFHPDTWSPVWRISDLLTGFLSFLLGNERTTGGVSSSNRQKQRLALASFEQNKKDALFCSLFPEFIADSNYKEGYGFRLCGNFDDIREVDTASSITSMLTELLMGRWRGFGWIAVLIVAGLMWWQKVVDKTFK
eukprot:GHVN01008376.1.p1 GENE.GHVN01008376.1~~GHVN01008376.1.p1  ORF type:complete len:138 (+),score=14.21 GHVN01008376.1:455-868(+)